MLLEGIHHITAITADGPANVDFYARLLGLRLVKQTVNQDDPTAYHLYYADEDGSPGADLTFFEYPGARRGEPGAGMVERIVHRVGSAAALDFWAERLGGEGIPVEREEGMLRFADPEGLRHQLVVTTAGDPPLIARSLEVPAEHALQGFAGVHALVAAVEPSERLYVEGLGMRRREEGDSTAAASFEARGEHRGGRIELALADRRGRAGSGTVHHVAWAVRGEEQEAWRERVEGAGMQPTPVIDRFYFRSVYFREPSGVLFELATMGPGFAVDEPAEHLGERLSLPPSFEGLRERLGKVLTPLPDTRVWRPATPVEA
jgi:glyoxalase family protein